MKYIAKHKKMVLLLALFGMVSCVDPYQLESSTFEDAIVVEATITNELKKQEIKISRTYRFEQEGPSAESGANVYVEDDLGTTYNFEEIDGKYLSTEEFQALPQRKYELNITTSNGKSYVSTEERLTTASPITELTALLTTKEGQRGIQIGVNSYDPTATSKYYRYEYEETFKIVSPSWTATNLNYSPPPTDDFYLSPRDPSTKTCYLSEPSNEIILESTSDLAEDRIQDFPVRFISDQNYIISHRYSILVTQYVENLAAFTFYETLKKLSSSESILSQTQPGFLMGNIKNPSNLSEKVIGFFDVASVSTKRIFFNYTDFFPGEPLPPFLYDCTPRTFDISVIPPNGLKPRDYLIIEINNNSLYYFDFQNPIYSMVVPPCGDCTSFASNIVPPFWEE